MSDEKITIGSQRNINDVALELTLLWHEKKFPDSIDEVAESFKTFYKTVVDAKNNR